MWTEIFRKYSPKTLVVFEGVIPLETFPLVEWHLREHADVPSFTVLKTQICVTRPQCVKCTLQGCPNFFFEKGPQPLLWSGFRATHVEMTISNITNLLNYYVVFILCIKFKYLAAGLGLETPRLACRLLLDESVTQQPHLSVYIDLREEAAVSN